MRWLNPFEELVKSLIEMRRTHRGIYDVIETIHDFKLLFSDGITKIRSLASCLKLNYYKRLMNVLWLNTDDNDNKRVLSHLKMKRGN